MGRHKLWRAQVKRIRRKRLRQKKAKERETLFEEDRKRQQMSPTYQAWLVEQEIIERFREEEETRLNIERHKEWERAEIVAQQEWCLRKQRTEKAKKEREEQELKIRKEWEEEQEKIKLVEEEKKKELEEKQKRQEELMQEIIDFVEKGGERPAFASDVSETNPNMPLCPFFSKTGACRFGDRCSRNHPRPALSKIVLLPNFYSHFGMDQSMLDEYDTDLLLEYEDSETYQHFREFYEDVVPELYRYGQPVAVVICCNAEPHLRGNVYVEYAREAESAKAVTSLNGRWYGGKDYFHVGDVPKGKHAISFTSSAIRVESFPIRTERGRNWQGGRGCRRIGASAERETSARGTREALTDRTMEGEGASGPGGMSGAGRKLQRECCIQLLTKKKRGPQAKKGKRRRGQGEKEIKQRKKKTGEGKERREVTERRDIQVEDIHMQKRCIVGEKEGVQEVAKHLIVLSTRRKGIEKGKEVKNPTGKGPKRTGMCPVCVRVMMLNSIIPKTQWNVIRNCPIQNALRRLLNMRIWIPEKCCPFLHQIRME